MTFIEPLKPGRYLTESVEVELVHADEVRKDLSNRGYTIIEDCECGGVVTIHAVKSWSDVKKQRPEAIWM